MKRWLASAFVAGSMLLTACDLISSPNLTITDTRVPALKVGQANFDVVAIDQASHRLYAADRSDQGLDVFDVSTSSAQYVDTIALGAPPNGVAVAPDLQRVFVGTSDGSVAVIDTSSTTNAAGVVTKTIATGADSVDLIDYSADRHEVFASNGIHGTIAAIDAQTGAVLGSFNVGYALEQPRYNPGDGMLYVTSPDAGALFQLDASTGAIKNKIAIGGCGPVGLAINPALNQAIVGCRFSVMRVNLRNPSDMESFNQVRAADVISYDAKADRFLAAAPAVQPVSEIGLLGGNPIAYITSIETATGGNSAALDDANGVVYTPDTRPGKGGVAAFPMPSGEGSLVASPTDLALIGGLIGAAAIVLIIVGRQADPIRRPEPVGRRRRA